MVKRISLTLALVTICACSRVPSTATPMTVVHAVAHTALEPGLGRWVEQSPPLTTIRLDLLSPLEILEAIENGTADIAIVGVPPPDGMFATPLYYEGIAIIVHPENPIESISLDSLDDLFRGEITNWSELNGEDLTAQPVVPLSADDTRVQFEALVMAGSSPAANALLAPTPEAMIQWTGENPGAIGYLPLSALTSEVRLVRVEGILPSSETVINGRYPLRFLVVAYAVEEPTGPLRQWLLTIQSSWASPTP